MPELRFTIPAELSDAITAAAMRSGSVKTKWIRAALEAASVPGADAPAPAPTQQPRRATQPKRSTATTGRIGNRPLVGYSKEVQSAGKR
jgi:hypothetical protein